MFRTKKDIDRHVQETFRKLKGENERTKRYYSFAKLYYQVADYETARRYASNYLSAYDSSAEAHKLLGQCLEVLGQKEKAVQQFKCSLMLQSQQNELVLKVCELLAEGDVLGDRNSYQYWCERAEQLYPHHPAVFRLKERLLTTKGDDSATDLEALYASELTVRPLDVGLRVRLLKLFLQKSRLSDAYNHALEVEMRAAFRDELKWYDCLADVFKAYWEENHNTCGWEFLLHYTSVLERGACLNLQEQQCSSKHSIADCVHALFNFDQVLEVASSQNPPGSEQTLFQEFLRHQRGQLCLHMATLLLKRSKKEQSNWRDTCRLVAPLLLHALAQPPDLHADWLIHAAKSRKKNAEWWIKEAAYRNSQAGHVILGLLHERRSQFLDRVTQFCSSNWRERVYQKVFNTRDQRQAMASSHFVNHSGFAEPPLQLPTVNELRPNDEISQKLHPGSLHHLVWLGLQELASSKKSGGTARLGPDFRCLVFDSLQLACNNLNSAGSETLSRLDVDAFLYATVLCARTTLEEQQAAGIVISEQPPTLPASITEQLCTVAQAKWWTAAYRVYTNQSKGDLGEIRQTLQRGIEVVRVLGNHGLDVRLIVQLARSFSERASAMLARTEATSDLAAVEAQASLYWTSALPLLDKLQRNQAIRAPHTRLFEYQGKELSTAEVNALIEEGRFFLACQLMKEEKCEKALEAFQQLKSPYASFHQAMIYKRLAVEELGDQRRELITSEMRSRHIVLLSKARECLYLTLDRLRSPGVDRRHPLNTELSTHIEEIESQLDRIDPDVWQNDVNHNESDGISDGSVSSAGGDNVNSLAGLNSSSMYLHLTPRHLSSQKLASTPYRGTHRTGLESVDTPGQDNTRRTEARPSPERLEAQIRNMMHGRDTLMQTVLQQNKALLESNKNVAASLSKVAQGLDELKNLIQEMIRKDTVKRGDLQLNSDLPQVCDPEEDLYVFDEDYSEEVNLTAAHLSQYHQQAFPPYPSYPGYPRQMSAMLGTSTVTYGPPPPGEVTTAAPPPPLLPPGGFFRNVDPAGLVYQQTLGYYGQGALPFSEGQQLPDFRGTAAAAPVFTRLINPPPVISTATLTEPVVVPPILQPPKLVHPMGPVNVVITSSDTLPTTAPLTQPTLSVTIPAQHRLGAPLVHTPGVLPPTVGLPQPTFPVHQPIPLVQAQTLPTNVPHAFQISMPPQAQLPHASMLEKGAAALSPVLPISTDTLLQSVPSPVYSAVVPDRSPSSKERASPPKPHRLPTSTTVDEDEDVEHDPCPDFEPVIPLPAEIELTTGEEEETVLFASRAKLFRFVEKEWKERGVGLLKLLYHQATGKVRVLMRREQVLKVCANHYMSTDMELTAMKDRAYMWVAYDYADEKVQLEKLCARFKTPDEAANFRDAFDRARGILRNSKPSPVKTSSTVALTPPNKSPLSTVSSSITDKITVGGFTFTAAPTFKVDSKPSQCATSKDVKEDKENADNSLPKPSPFKNMFFFNVPAKSSAQSDKLTTELDKSTTVADKPATELMKISKEPASFTSEPTSNFDEPPPLRRPHSSLLSSPSVEQVKVVLPSKGKEVCETGEKLMFNSPVAVTFSTLASVAKEPAFKKDDNFKGFEGAGKPLFGGSVTPTSTTPKSKKTELVDVGGNDDTTEEFVPTAEFKPVIPLPELVKVKTGEEDEEVLFQERAKLLRFDSEGKQWKERGIGNMKVLKNSSSGKVRLLMRREQVLKVCCNHVIISSMQFKALSTSDRAWSWFAQDYSEGEVRPELLAIKFKTVEQAQSFKSVIDDVQSNINSEQLPTASESSAIQEKSPQTDVWKCSCLFPNAADAKKCRSCNKFKPYSPKDSAPAPGLPSLSHLHKPPPGSWECSTCYIRNKSDAKQCVACDSVNPKTKSVEFDVQPVSEPEPKPDQWECKTCNTKNEESATSCASCQTERQKPYLEKQIGPSLMDKFRPKAGSWECKGCYIRNTGSEIECVACGAPRPGHEAAAKSKSSDNMALKFDILSSAIDSQSQGFSFGIPPGAAEPPGFKFGITPSSSVSTPPTTSLFTAPANKVEFTFGTPPVTLLQSQAMTGPVKKDSAKPFVFEPTTAAKPFCFGNSVSTTNEVTTGSFAFGEKDSQTREITPPKDGAPRNFVFGSPGKFDFNFSGLRPKSPVKSPKSPGIVGISGGEEESGSEPEEDEGEHIFFHPVIPLPDKVPLYTGEEDEELLYCHRAKLFRYTAGEWKERGLGDIKLLKNGTTHKVRLVMRREQVLKICLNHFLTPNIIFHEKDEKSWLWNAPDFSEGEIQNESFALRFQNKDIATSFKEAIYKAQLELGQPQQSDVREKATSRTSADTTPTVSSTVDDTVTSSALKNFTFSLPEGYSSKTTIPDSVLVTSGSQSEPKGAARSLFGLPRSPSTFTSEEDDVKVVYEMTVSAEEKAEAERLLLPANFYAYRRKPPCPGCRGCEQDKDTEEEVSAVKNMEKSNQEQKKTVIAPSVFSIPKSGTLVFSQQPSSSDASSEQRSTLSFGSVPKTSIVFGQLSSDATLPKTTAASLIFGQTNTVVSQGPIVSSIFGQLSASPTVQSSEVPPSVPTSFFSQTSSSFSVPMNHTSIFTQVTSVSQPTSTPVAFSEVSTTEGSMKPVFGQPTSTFHGQKPLIFGQQAFGSSLSNKTVGTPIFGQPSTVGAGGMASATPVFGSRPSTDTLTDTPLTTVATTTVFTSSVFSSKPFSFSSEPTQPFSFDYSDKKGGEQEAPKAVGFSFTPKSAIDSFTFSLPTADNKVEVTNLSKTEVKAAESQEDESVPFLPSDSSLSFAALAQSSERFNSVSSNRYLWENADTTVFGNSPLTRSARTASMSPAKKITPNDKDSSDEEGDVGEGSTHDPQFEPIIALPDAIEVRTGEEDEIKVFCHRAKLYRFESATREWKERGLGEMKILHDPAKGTYRLLLRREQVHKVVCNQLVVPGLTLSPLQTSDRAWVWGGVNHAEDEACIEKLAVQFKLPETAQDFRAKLEHCVQEVTRRSELSERLDSSTGSLLHERVSSESEGFEEEDEDEEDEDELERNVMFEKRATLMVRRPGVPEWSVLGQGDLQVAYDPDFFAARIYVEADGTRQMLCNSIIAINTSLELRKKDCEWSAVDYSEQVPVERTFLARFSSETSAKEFEQIFLEGKNMAHQTGVVDHLDPEEVLED